MSGRFNILGGDRRAHALRSESVVLGAVLWSRAALLRELADASGEVVGTAWLVSCAATEEERRRAIYPFPAADLVVIATPERVCLERAATDADRAGAKWPPDEIRSWWRRYEPPCAGGGPWTSVVADSFGVPYSDREEAAG